MRETIFIPVGLTKLNNSKLVKKWKVMARKNYDRKVNKIS